jgi:putative glycosyl hydrolase-like family 6 (GHL6) protein/glycosyl hydrolase family 42 (putative beta-galactosidase)
MITRREFLAASSASFVVAAVGSRESPAAERPWYATMRRCGQLNLNERDPLTLDVRSWLDYWASLKLDALLLNGGGIVAFYPTAVPYHHRSEFLGSRDLFGELAAATKARNIRLVARMDCNYAYEDALKAHPEWFERNRDGSPRPHGESPWLYKTCMFSPYFTDQMSAIYRELNARYPVDGFFTNGWPSTGELTICHCESCQKVYREQVGGVPPDGTDATSPVYRKYYDTYMARVVDVWTRWQAVVTEARPDSVYVGNLGGGIRTVKNVKRLGEVARWFNADHQGRGGDTVIWDCAQQGRVARAVMGDRTVTNVTGAYSNSRPTWRHVTKAPAETTMWMAQTAASGMVPWFHWLGGAPEDSRWKVVGREFFQWLAEHEAHFRNTASIADLAVLYPQRTIAFYRSGSGPKDLRGSDRAQTADYLQGLYYALLEGRFLFDFVHEDDLRPDTLRKYRALLIPNAAYLSDEHCRQLRDYVSAGGSLLATFETARYDEWGDRRADLGLADLFGVSAAGETIGPFGNSYMRIETRHPVLAGFDGTALLPGPENRVPMRAAASGGSVPGSPLTVVPNYPAFPPEMVFPRTPRTDEPAAIFRERGGSRIAYFAGDVDRTFWRSGNTDLSLLLQNAVRWVRGDAAPLASLEGDGVVEAFAWQTEPGYALHILNYTNPNMTRGFFRRFYPIGPQKALVTVARGRRIAAVRALRAGRTLPFAQDGDLVRFEVPGVTDYEVIALT